jgi:hypothetical protein
LEEWIESDAAFDRQVAAAEEAKCRTASEAAMCVALHPHLHQVLKLTNPKMRNGCNPETLKPKTAAMAKPYSPKRMQWRNPKTRNDCDGQTLNPESAALSKP